MNEAAITILPSEKLLQRWLSDFQANDHAFGTILRYRSAIESFLSWYERQEHYPFTLASLTPIALVVYRDFLQSTQTQATSLVNEYVSALRTWFAWLDEYGYLDVNPA